jgi:hypothetical protein
MLEPFLNWVSGHKEALLVLASFLVPVTSILVAMVSYRAVRSGPAVQMQIARLQQELAERQYKVHEAQTEISRSQLHFTIAGAYEQAWISKFQDSMADLLGLAARCSVIAGTLQKPEAKQYIEQYTELFKELTEKRDQILAIVSKLSIQVSADGDDGLGLLNLIREWIFIPIEQFDSVTWSLRERNVVSSAHSLVQAHKSAIHLTNPAPNS